MTKAVTLYGIANCDTIKKAKAWLQQCDVEFVFHDYRAQGISTEQIQDFAASLGWDAMINRRGTTWRNLPENTRTNIDHDLAIEVMLQNPAIIKRPILAKNNKLHVGFSIQQYEEIFG
jgi:arsenate reductase